MKNKEAETYSRTILTKKEAGYKKNKEKRKRNRKVGRKIPIKK